MRRFTPLALAALLASFAGCGDDDDDGDASPTPIGLAVRDSFTEDFAGDFPGDTWVVADGTASVDPEARIDDPALTVSGDDRVQTNFMFSSAEPFSLSFQLNPVLGPASSRFEFRLERVGAPDEEAKFDLRLEDGQVRLEILEAGKDDVFPSKDEFHTVTFAMTADRTATWSIDGAPLLSRPDFPDAMWRIELRAIDAGTSALHLDNVVLTR